MDQFSDYIVYVDESGDHGLINCDPSYPMFVLAFCIFKKDDYAANVCPALQAFKFKHFGHDMVVLHEHEMRKATGPFAFLTDAVRREEFMGDFNKLVTEAAFTVIAIVVRKDLLISKYTKPENPYHLALEYGLERVNKHLTRRGQVGTVSHLIFEGRGKNEDKDLELEFRRVCDVKDFGREGVNFELIFAHKGTNSCGLQLADMIARPIGRKALHPEQENRAFAIIEAKLDRNPNGIVDGWGLKYVP